MSGAQNVVSNIRRYVNNMPQSQRKAMLASVACQLRSRLVVNCLVLLLACGTEAGPIFFLVMGDWHLTCKHMQCHILTLMARVL